MFRANSQIRSAPCQNAQGLCPSTNFDLNAHPSGFIMRRFPQIGGGKKIRADNKAALPLFADF